jgi:hypothetical protein
MLPQIPGKLLLGNCSPGVIASVPAWYQPVAVLVSQSASEFS